MNPIRTSSSYCILLDYRKSTLSWFAVQLLSPAPLRTNLVHSVLNPRSSQNRQMGMKREPAAHCRAKHLHEGRSLVLYSRSPASAAPQCPAKSALYQAPKTTPEHPTAVRVFGRSISAECNSDCLTFIFWPHYSPGPSISLNQIDDSVLPLTFGLPSRQQFAIRGRDGSYSAKICSRARQPSHERGRLVGLPGCPRYLADGGSKF